MRSIAKRSAQAKRRHLRRKGAHRHPIFTLDELTWLKSCHRLEEQSPFPDRSQFRKDEERQRRIEEHARRIELLLRR